MSAPARYTTTEAAQKAADRWRKEAEGLRLLADRGRDHMRRLITAKREEARRLSAEADTLRDVLDALEGFERQAGLVREVDPQDDEP